MSDPQVVREHLLSKQVCVPEEWTDQQVLEFAGDSGTSAGWQIRREGDPMLIGHPERVTCGARQGYVHIVLDC